MSFDYNETEVFSHIHLVKTDVSGVSGISKWGYLCDSCGRNSTYSYKDEAAQITSNLDALVSYWYLHLISDHALSLPVVKKRKPCSFSAKVSKYTGGSAAMLYCSLLEDHLGLHELYYGDELYYGAKKD